MRKHILFAFAFLFSALSASAEETVPTYTWKAMGGGVALKDLAITNTAVLLYDANKCSQSNLVAQSKLGKRLLETDYIIGNVVTNAMIPTSGEFSYDGEPVGQVWNAYFALRVERNNKVYLYVSTSVPTMGTALSTANIAFESQAEWAYTLVAGDTYDGPGWYEIPAVDPGALVPSAGMTECLVTATDEQSALAKVSIAGPGEAIVSTDVYTNYFTVSATPKSEGTWLVRAELNAEKIELDKTTSSFAAQLAELAAAGGTTVTVEITAKSGLYYRVIISSAAGGSFEPAEGDKGTQATGNKAKVPVAVPEGNQGFFKIEVSPNEREE